MKKKKLIVFIAIEFLVIVGLVFAIRYLKGVFYDRAMTFYQEEEYENARTIFLKEGYYKDSRQKVKELTYVIGKQLMNNLEFIEAKEEFDKYPDDEKFRLKSMNCEMEMARDLILDGKFLEAGIIMSDLVYDDELMLDFCGIPEDTFDTYTILNPYPQKMYKPEKIRRYNGYGISFFFHSEKADGPLDDYYSVWVDERGGDTRYGVHYFAYGAPFEIWEYVDGEYVRTLDIKEYR